MKKILLLSITALLLSGCSQELPESSAEISAVSEISTVSATDDTSFVQFPSGVSTYARGKLKYTDGTISVIFTDEFYISNDSYTPANGIYLQNDNGTATLLIENVTDNTVTNEEMLTYLYETYPYSEISSAENGDIVSWYIVTDKTGHNAVTFQKIRVADTGYRQICLTCRQADMDKYKKIFDTLNFS